MKESLLVGIFALLILTDCAHRPLPIATAYPATAQLKMQAAYHWDILAKDMATRLKKTVNTSFPNAIKKPAVFVKFTNAQEKIPFGKAFFNLLTARLVQEGLVVMDNSNARYGKTLQVEYEMQVIHHKDRRLTYPPPGVFTALAAGVWLVAQAQDHWTNPGLAAFPFTAAADVNSYMAYYLPGETNTEVIITTAATMGQQYIFSDARIYYINEGDFDHYENINKNYRVVNQ